MPRVDYFFPANYDSKSNKELIKFLKIYAHTYKQAATKSQFYVAKRQLKAQTNKENIHIGTDLSVQTPIKKQKFKLL